MTLIKRLSCASILALITAQSNATAQTQTANETFNDEVIVTAQRRAETISDVPAAISAFDAGAIEKVGLDGLDTISAQIPSFYFGSFGPTRPQLYIRGIGTRQFDPGSESSVGVFVDDTYLGRSSGSFGSLKDIERIEVLRGPQGTLYGRNTIGGAINVISKAPTDELNGKIDVGVTNDNGFNVMGAVGGPLNQDGTLQARIAGWSSQRDGYMVNTSTGNTFQGVDNTGGRLRLRYIPSDTLKVDLTAEYIEDGNEAAFAGFNRGSASNPDTVFFSRSTGIRYTGGNEGALSSDPTLNRNALNLIGRIEYDLDGFSLTSITGFRSLESSESRDLEGSSLAVIEQVSAEDSDQFTQEFRLSSIDGGYLTMDGKFDWIIGAFHYSDQSERSDAFTIGTDAVINGGVRTAVDVAAAEYDTKSYAVFADATYHISDALALTGGLRWTRDEKEVVHTGTTTDALPIIRTDFTQANDESYESVDFKIVGEYEVSDNVNAYASFSTGFKGGGFQYIPFSQSAASATFEPEEIEAYELGLKTNWFNRRLGLNVSAYHYDYDNLQVSSITLSPLDNAPITAINNAATSKIDGIDFEGYLQITDSFRINGSLGLLDAKYTSYQDGSKNFDDTRLVRAPEYSFSLGGEWGFVLSQDINMTIRMDYSYLDDFFHEPGAGDPSLVGTGALSIEQGYGLMNIKAIFDIQDQYRITAFMNNAGDTQYRRTINALANTAADFPGTPRIYGVKASYTF